MKIKEILAAYPKRKNPYSYEKGSMLVTFTPKKLSDKESMRTCFILAKSLTLKQIAYVMSCSTQVVSRAIRCYYTMYGEE